MSKVTLFNKCLGLNDARAFGTQIMKTNPRDPEAGQAELIDCRNLTFTDDGCLEKIPALVAVLTHTAPVTGLSAGSRFFFQDGVDVNEWTGGITVVKRFPLVPGSVVHTPIDVRVAAAATVHKSVNPSTAMVTATVGTNPNPATSKPFSAMPVYKQAFIHGAKLFAVNAADPRFLQYSEDYGYDLWALGDGFIPHATNIMQAGAIPGVIVATHANGVTVYSGDFPFEKKFYPCLPLDKTLFSGQVSKAVGYLHVLLCVDGIYTVTPEGIFARLTEAIDFVTAFNTSYVGATTTDRKYLAVGNLHTIEFDFKNNGLLKRDSFAATGVCRYGDTAYLSVGSQVMKLGAEIDTGGTFPCSMTLPYSDLSASGVKSLEYLYFTGTMSGDMTITATDQTGKTWEVEVSDELVNVSNYRIKTPKGVLGNHISFKLECTSGAFRIEELTAVFAASKRSR
jgi:hypothetical protein